MGAKHTALVQRELPTPYSTDPNLLIGLVSRRGGGKDEVAGSVTLLPMRSRPSCARRV